ncbi:MAG: hypothetical protein NVSMB14_13950 [Isosphaeraceae bacterium]
MLANADVFGIGATLHHMLTGIDPRTRSRSAPFSADELPRSVSAELRRFVARCAAPRPSDRFADARQALEAIREISKAPKIASQKVAPATDREIPVAELINDWAIGEEAFRNSRHIYFRARKAFRNFKVPDRSYSQSDPDEWLDALVRVPVFETERSALDFELDRVFGRPASSWFPEPIDVIEWRHDDKTKTCLVFADPGGEPSTAATEKLSATFRELKQAILAEGLDFPGEFDLADFLIDPITERATFLGTDRLVPAASKSAIP